MRHMIITIAISIAGVCNLAPAAAPNGWVCFASGNDVWRAPVGGDRELLAENVDAKHACWSYDGSIIFYITGSGDIYAMNNDGGSRRKIGTADTKKYSAIAAYRPENRSVLCVDQETFYKINADDGNGRTEVAHAGASVDGEIAISRDGTRIAFRSGESGGGGKLKKLTVGGNPTGYAGNCSASLSPDGQLLTENQSGHSELDLFNWNGDFYDNLHAGDIGHWDNQAFAVNSNEWICALDDDDQLNDNKGTAVGVVSIHDHAYIATTWSGSHTQYPRLFIGDLPTVNAPETWRLSVENGDGDGAYTEGTAVAITANDPSIGMMFDAWTGDISHVATITESQTTVTMPNADIAVAASYKAIPTYTLSVNNGAGDGSYQAGELVSISANAPPAGFVFEKWTGDVSHIADVAASQTMILMPEADISVSANYKSAPTYALTVTHGSGSGAYEEGALVDINADTPAPGMIFDAWTGDVAHVDNLSASQTTITMPAADVSVTAVYAHAPSELFTLTVSNGSGGGQYAEGAQIAISADSPQNGNMFDRWTGDVNHVADVNSSQTTVSMPATNIAISATYSELPASAYTLTVDNGQGDGEYASGMAVDITANTPPAGKTFDTWTGDVAYLADMYAASTIVTMPEANITVAAAYADEPAQPAPTRITSPAEGAILTEGAQMTLTAEGSGIQWSYDANSDKLGEIDIGQGTEVVFTVPDNVSGPRTITIFCKGQNGDDQIECHIDHATGTSLSSAAPALGCFSGPRRQGAAAIIFSTPTAQDVRITIFDSRGSAVQTLADQRFPRGIHEIVWDGRNGAGSKVARGVYSAILQSTGSMQSWKIVLANQP